MSTRKVTRHEIKHDEFVSSVGRATQWAEEHLSQLAWTGAGILALAGLVWGLWAWRESRILDGEAAFARVRAAWEAPVDPASLGGSGESFPTDQERLREVLLRADTVIAEHGSTPSGNRARYYRGLALFGLKEWAQAREAMEEFVRSDPRGFLAPHARRKIAQTYEREGDLERACGIYRELAAVEVAEFPPELALLDLGRCLDERGEGAEARATYQKLLDDHPESPYAIEARTRLNELEG